MIPFPNEETPATEPKSNGSLKYAILTAVIGSAVVVGVWWGTLPPSRRHVPPPQEPAGVMEMTPFVLPGIRNPKIQKASEVELPDETEIIGIEAQGKYRAYRVLAFHSLGGHVVNDLVGDVPITVTYCDRSNCTQVYTDEKRGEALKIDLGGYMRKMFLKADNAFYFQDTGESTAKELGTKIGHDFHRFERTTWGKWRQAHPETEIYVGKMPAPK